MHERSYRRPVGMAAAILSAACLCSCDAGNGIRLPARESDPFDTSGLTLVARIIHVSDTHVVDEESPARFAGAQFITRSAWRPYEAYSTQLFDGILRASNRIHAAGRAVSFVIHTGDACDNSQMNELAWFTGVFDGELIDPLTGPDDRPPEARPDPSLDPHAPFQAQGLYRTGVHGDAASIPWYAVFGNHDAYAIGVFPIFEDPAGFRTAPLPLEERPDILLPGELNPLAALAYGNVTPAMPGPPEFLQFPRAIETNPTRAFFNKREFIHAMFDTITEPAGHGFTDRDDGPSWYSVAPVPGLRLIGLDTCDPAHQVPGYFYHDGSILQDQVSFLRAELAAAEQRDELVVVASHHPSESLMGVYGSAVIGAGFQAILNEYPNVIVHLAGHTHRNRVWDRGGYVEIETCSTLDDPQEARVVEIWRGDMPAEVAVAYEMFSHLDDALPPLGEDPLRALRAEAREIAKSAARSSRLNLGPGTPPSDQRPAERDRWGVFITPGRFDRR